MELESVCERSDPRRSGATNSVSPARFCFALNAPGDFSGRPSITFAWRPRSSRRNSSTVFGVRDILCENPGNDTKCAEHVVRIFRAVLRDSPVKDDRCSLVDLELRALDEVREVRLEEREVFLFAAHAVARAGERAPPSGRSACRREKSSSRFRIVGLFPLRARFRPSCANERCASRAACRWSASSALNSSFSPSRGRACVLRREGGSRSFRLAYSRSLSSRPSISARDRRRATPFQRARRRALFSRYARARLRSHEEADERCVARQQPRTFARAERDRRQLDVARDILQRETPNRPWRGRPRTPFDR